MTAGRPKLALQTAIATGAVIANPQRYQASIDLSLHPLGPPSPEIFDNDLADQWLFFVKSVSWLTEADRGLVELACMYRANRWRLASFRSPIGFGITQTTETNRRRNVELFARPNNGDPDLMFIAVDDKATAIELRILEKLGCTPTSRPKVTPANGKSSGRRKDWW
jgi:hypothetical protein